MSLPARISAAVFLIAAAGLASAAGEDSNVTVVSSRASADFVMSKGPDGKVLPEPVVFGEGGHWTGTVRDSTIDSIVFLDVAKAMISPLSKRGFVPTKDPKRAKELIMVYWGRTETPGRFDGSDAARVMQDAAANAANHRAASMQAKTFSEQTFVPPPMAMVCGKFDPGTTVDQFAGQIDADSQMAGALALGAAENRARDLRDEKNAELLGYESWWNATSNYAGTPLQHRRQDLLDELEQDRYFVILMSYDFQTLWKHKQHKLLWETRFSVNQRGVDFGKALPLMVQNASRYFGRDSNGLVRDTLPLGRVEVGPIQALGVVASAK
ncbi:MAG TPA: hypothetical protein VGF85_09345 [Opitutaceae bacterium]|jgi:hypothetical protein